jgi:serine/threonine protein kinase
VPVRGWPSPIPLRRFRAPANHDIVSSSLQEQLQLALGETYLLERELGGGGMSRVFVANERALGRKVVVKVLLPELAATVNIERFRREILLAAQLQHPHIVPLLSAGEADKLPYFIMPFVTGESLRARITREGEFPIADTVRILRDIVSALAYAHGYGVVHRDVKPDNVLLSHGVAVVTDFGVAKALSASSGASGSGITSVGVALGTPAYMAPEQATASPHTDHRADIYALGAMAYELLTGLPPFAGRSAQAVLAAQVIEEPDPVERRRPAVPPMLATLVRECLCKRPADRPQSAAQVMHVLDAIATPSGGTAATTAVRVPAISPRSTARRKWLAGSGVALALLLAGGVLWFRRSPAATDTRIPTATASSKDSLTAVAQVPAPVETTRPTITQPRPQRARLPTPPVTPPPKQPTRPIAEAPPREDSSPTDTSRAAAKPAAVPAPAAPADSLPLSLPPPVREPAPAPTVPPPPKPPSAPTDQRRAIRAVVAEYAAAIESRSLGGLRRVYPGMTPMQQRGWEQFFQLVREVKADLTLAQIQVSAGSAEGQITGIYTYLNTSTGRPEHQPVSFKASFQSEGGKWRLAQVR